jgi:hypothetical protein
VSLPLASAFLASVAATAAALTLPPAWTAAAIAGVAGAVATFQRPTAGLSLLIFSMLLSPELSIGSAGTRPITIRYDDILLVLVSLAYLGRIAFKKDLPLLRWTPAHPPIFCYACACALSTGLGILRGDILPLKGIFYAAKYLQYFVIYFLAVNLLEDRGAVRRALGLAAATALLVTLYAYHYHFLTGDRTTAPFDDPLHGVREASEPGTLGGYYIVVFGTLLGLATELPPSGLASCLGLLLFMFPAFLLTLSRASYAGLAASSLAVLLLARRRKLLVASAAALVCGLVLFNPALREKTASRIELTFHGGQNRELHPFRFLGYSFELEDSAAQRVWAWERILTQKLPRHPLLGHGATGIGFEDTQYGTILGELGLLGLLVFGWLASAIGGMALRTAARAQEPFDRGLALGLACALAGLLTHAFTSNTFIIIKIMEPFWLLAALVAAIGRIPETGRS